MAKVTLKRLMLLLALLVLAAAPGLAAAAGSGQGASSNPGKTVDPSTLPRFAAPVAPDASGAPPFVPKQYLPEVIQLKKQWQLDPEGVSIPMAAGRAAREADVSADQDAAAPGAAAPVLGLSFNGIPYTGWYPPDPIMAVGPSHILVMTNSSFAVYNKAGTKLFQSTLASWFAGVTPGTTQIFDPKCTYDPWGQRFIMVALAMKTTSPTTSYYLVSVSKTNSAAGSWWNWKLNAKQNGSTTTNNWADYPGLGFDSGSASTGGIYITSNQFAFGGGFQYAKLRILKKSQLYAGAAVTWYDFWNFTNLNGSKVFTWQPVHTYTAVSSGGFPYQYLVNTESSGSGSGVTRWRVWKPTAAVPTLTRLGRTAVQAYTAPPDAVQKGGTTRIDTGDCRLYNAVYFGGRVYTTTAEAFNFGGGDIESCLRYLKINFTSGTAEFDSTYGGTNFFYFYPAICTDSVGNIYWVFSRSSATEYAGVRYTGRKTTDAAMQASSVLKAGEAFYVQLDDSGRNRWGDYSGIARDFSTGYIWLYGEYAKPGNTWATRIGRTKF